MSELLPGRELDALVAEKVMGWADFWRSHGLLYGYPPNEQAMGIDGERVPVPCYSTDIAAAWQLIDHHPHYVYLMRSVNVTRFGFADHMTWKCRFYAPQSCEVEADTAPLAICLAALKAIAGDRA